MKITAEELRKVFDEAWLNTYTPNLQNSVGAEEAAFLAVARYVAERQRGMEPTQEMLRALFVLPDMGENGTIIRHSVDKLPAAYRAMQSVAPLVVE